MLYALSEYAYHAGTPLRAAARIAREFWGAPYNPVAETSLGRNIFAASDLGRPRRRGGVRR